MAYKILSIDGGGMRGVLAGTLLQAVERVVKNITGGSLLDYFDGISGVSAGSILATGIALGKTPADLLQVLHDRGKHIFPALYREVRKVDFLQFVGNFALYPHQLGNEIGIANVLQDTFRQGNLDPTIADIHNIDLLVLAYDVQSRNTTFFASGNQKYGHQKLWYDDLPLWQICTASASAPTFFPPYDLPYGNSGQFLPHIDGGVAANNPDMAALAHALRLDLKRKLTDVAILSIGTGKVTKPHTYQDVDRWGTLQWVTHLPDIFLDPSAEISGAICRQILTSQHNNTRYLRLNMDLNERYIGDRQPERLRDLNPEPFNRYIYEKTQQKKFVDEAIDDPSLFNLFVEVAEAYLARGTVVFDDGQVCSVEGAIEDFILQHAE